MYSSPKVYPICKLMNGRRFGFLWITLFLFWGCEEPAASGGLPLNTKEISGSGFLKFPINSDSNAPKMKVFYHIPKNAHTQSPILFVFHGNGRDAENCRNLLLKEAETRNLIIICPEFSTSLFPGSNAYQLGGMFDNGENAKKEELRDPSKWTFALVEKIFDKFTGSLESALKYYDMFGHSAGAQFVHRYFSFVPNSRMKKAVSAASGWYTLPRTDIDFPYGLGQTGLIESNLEDIFAKNILISVGSLDTDPNSSALRHDTESDAQGINRVERAEYYFNECQKQASTNGFPLSWKFKKNAGVEHDFLGNAKAALQWLYP